jgi:hypothetical protein
MTVEIQDARVEKIWRWYQEAMWKHANRRVDYPSDTDPRKTYQYRWMQAFIKKLNEWQFDDRLAEMMVDAVVRYAVTHKLLRMGASILAMQKVLDVCYHDACHRKRVSHDFGQDLKIGRELLIRHQGQLLCASRPGGYVNLVQWYKTGKLTMHFMSLSKTCIDALNALRQLDIDQRSEIPSHITLLRNRLLLLSCPERTSIAHQILGNDLLPT